MNIKSMLDGGHVCLIGDYLYSLVKFNEKELQKALKMLSVKQPLITSQIELSENSEAILHPERVEPEFIFAEADVDELVDDKKTQGLNFWEKLFEFYVLNKNTLVVFSHTVGGFAKVVPEITVTSFGHRSIFSIKVS